MVQSMMNMRVDKVIENGRLEAAWIQALDGLPKVTDFLLALDATQMSTWHRIVCGPPMYTLLELALETLVGAKCKPRSLILRYAADDEFVCTKIPDWESLNLELLEDLDVFFEVDYLSRNWDYRKSFKLESAMVVSNLLLRSMETLQSLTLSKEALSCIGPDHVAPSPPGLGHLKTLKLCNGAAIAQRLSAWLRQCTGLLELHLDHIYNNPNSFVEHWEPVFTAIKDHPNKLLIDMRHIQLEIYAQYTPGSFRHQVPEKPNLDHLESQTLLKQVVSMITNYISGRGDWKVEEWWSPVELDEESDENDYDDGLSEYDDIGDMMDDEYDDWGANEY